MYLLSVLRTLIQALAQTAFIFSVNLNVTAHLNLVHRKPAIGTIITLRTTIWVLRHSTLTCRSKAITMVAVGTPRPILRRTRHDKLPNKIMRPHYLWNMTFAASAKPTATKARRHHTVKLWGILRGGATDPTRLEGWVSLYETRSLPDSKKCKKRIG